MTDNWSKQSIVDAYNSGRRDFSEENFSGLDLREITLTGANLRDANMTGANLENANLVNANLRGADLTGANLRRANLTGADLRWANLVNANLDYSSWPLWCGSLDVKVDKKIAVQLMYHACALDCSDPEYQEARTKVLDFANQIHRTDVKRLK
jgi:hypothetical protein